MKHPEIENNSVEIEAADLIKSEQLIKKSKSIIVYNDDINTFDFVIECLIKICGHDEIQAEQCAYIVHYKGKCAVKSDAFDMLKPLCIELLKKGLTAEIE